LDYPIPVKASSTATSSDLGIFFNPIEDAINLGAYEACALEAVGITKAKVF